MGPPDILVDDICFRLAEAGLLGPLSSGNVSIRDRDHNRMHITAKGQKLGSRVRSVGVSLSHSLEDLVDLKDEVPLKPSTETPLHHVMYHELDVDAVVHLHSPWVTAFASCAVYSFLPHLHYHSVLLGSYIPLIPFEAPGSLQLALLVQKNLRSYPSARALVMSNHGALVGGTLENVVDLSIVLEDACRLASLNAGSGCRVLHRGQIEDVKRMFASYYAS